MDNNLILIPEIIQILIHSDGYSGTEINSPNSEKKYRIQEIMLGAGSNRKPVVYTKFFLSPNVECKAEILENGKLRII